jgi:hypothetical protein
MGQTTPQTKACDGLDPREIFLARASARFLLVEAGTLKIDDAITGLIPAFREIAGIAPCACAREIVARMERYRPARARRFSR